MKESNYYLDITNSIEKHFSFLNNFDFPKFKMRQVAYEFNFETKNNFVSIDISLEAIISTPIWAKINQYNIANLELENPKIKNYQNQLKVNYDDLFNQYLKTNKNVFLEKIAEKYIIKGKTINDEYIFELSEMLKRNLTVLNGNLEVLRINTEILTKEYDLKVIKNRIENEIYTLEYQFLSDSDYDAFEEFKNLNDIKPFLSERNEITKYRILDCNLNEISLK